MSWNQLFNPDIWGKNGLTGHFAPRFWILSVSVQWCHHLCLLLRKINILQANLAQMGIRTLDIAKGDLCQCYSVSSQPPSLVLKHIPFQRKWISVQDRNSIQQRTSAPKEIQWRRIYHRLTSCLKVDLISRLEAWTRCRDNGSNCLANQITGKLAEIVF